MCVFSSRRRHTRYWRDWSSDVCSSDLGDRPLQLLRAVRGLELVELPAADQCCGFGGTFAVKNAETSTAMLTDKMANVLSTHAEVCTAGDASCLMHIGGGLSRLRSGTRTVHLAEILASDRKSTRLNSSHANISYAVFCLKKKKKKNIH